MGDLINEFISYGKPTQGKTVSRYDHRVDAMRYMLSSIPRSSRHRERLTRFRVLFEEQTTYMDGHVGEWRQRAWRFKFWRRWFWKT